MLTDEPLGKASYRTLSGRVVTEIVDRAGDWIRMFDSISTGAAAICNSLSKTGLYKHVLKIWNPLSVPS